MIRESGLEVVEAQPVFIELQPGRVNWKGVHDSNSAFAEKLLAARAIRSGSLPPIAGGASASDYLENKLLDHIVGKTSFTMPSTVALALTTATPDDTKTGTTITEAGYTGYARKTTAGSDWTAAAAGSAVTANTLTFAACTASSATVIGWALCDATTVGNVLVWGTATSTVISTTQTPATIAAGGLVVNLD